MQNCKQCKHCEIDYEWDGEYEFEVLSCKKTDIKKYESQDYDCDFPHFKKRIMRKQREEYTKCDKCEYASECSLIEITTLRDNFKHFLPQLKNVCKKEKNHERLR